MLHARTSSAEVLNGAEQQIIDTLETPLNEPSAKKIEPRLGAGPIVTSGLNAGGTQKVYAVPLIFFRYKDLLSIDETQARLNFFSADSAVGAAGWRAGPMIKVDIGRKGFGGGAHGRVGVSVEAGGFVSYSYGRLRLRARVRQDVADGHHGALAEFDIKSGLYRAGKFSLGGQISTAWASKRYMRAFFGVTPMQSAATGLATYSPGSGFKDVRASLTAEYKISPHWATAASLQYVHRLGEANHSPIVQARGTANRINTGVFVLYTF